MEIVFIIIWLLIVFFGGKNNKSVKTVSELIQKKAREPRYKTSASRAGDTDAFGTQSHATSQNPRKKRTSSPWEEHPTGKADLRAASLEDRQTKRMMEMLEDHDDVSDSYDTYEPPPTPSPAEETPVPAQESVHHDTAPVVTQKHDESHSADVNSYVGDIIEKRRAERAKPSKTLPFRNNVRQAFIFKELLDKPVALKR